MLEKLEDDDDGLFSDDESRQKGSLGTCLRPMAASWRTGKHWMTRKKAVCTLVMSLLQHLLLI